MAKEVLYKFLFETYTAQVSEYCKALYFDVASADPVIRGKFFEFYLVFDLVKKRREYFFNMAMTTKSDEEETCP